MHLFKGESPDPTSCIPGSFRLESKSSLIMRKSISKHLRAELTNNFHEGAYIVLYRQLRLARRIPGSAVFVDHTFVVQLSRLRPWRYASTHGIYKVRFDRGPASACSPSAFARPASNIGSYRGNENEFQGTTSRSHICIIAAHCPHTSPDYFCFSTVCGRLVHGERPASTGCQRGYGFCTSCMAGSIQSTTQY